MQSTFLLIHCRGQNEFVTAETFERFCQCDQTWRNFAIWAIFFSVGRILLPLKIAQNSS
jgi:hypothetical protein